MPSTAVGSVRSKKSQVSVKSKGSKPSYVDETLTGAQKPRPTTSQHANIAIISKEELRKIREQTEKGLQADAHIITKTELDRMKGSTKIVTKDEEKQMKKMLDEQKEQQRGAAKARKKRIQEFDKDRASKIPPTEYQKGEKVKKEGLLKNAQDKLDEGKDDVKHMNQMCLYSK